MTSSSTGPGSAVITLSTRQERWTREGEQAAHRIFAVTGPAGVESALRRVKSGPAPEEFVTAFEATITRLAEPFDAAA